MTHLKAKLAVLALFTVCVLTDAHSQITPSADAYTNTGSSSTNYGANALLDLVSGSQTTYIQFNLASIPAGYTSTNVAKATLKLYVNAVSTAGNFNVNYVSGAWSEATITAKSSPALGSTIVSAVPLTSASPNQYILIDITSTLQAWLNGTEANNGIALVANSPLNASFNSKENANASHPAELDIVFVNSGPQGPSGPQGLQGATGPQGPIGLTGATGPQGPQGATGSQGTTGAQGPQGVSGPAGPQGAAGTNGTGFSFRNAFSSTATYAVNDVVPYSGSSYVAIMENGPNTQTPDQNPTAWSVMAQQGATGAQGPQGPIGLSGATGSTGAQGPQGATGLQGPIGLTGSTGPQGLVGFTGATGPQGIQGVEGTNGVGLNFRNIFNSTTTYAVNDVVSYNGSSYVATTANGPSTQTPDQNTSAWSIMAQQGLPGLPGATGAQGLPGMNGAQGPQGLPGYPG